MMVVVPCASTLPSRPNIASKAIAADELIAAAERHALTLGCMATLSEVQRAVVNLRLVDEIPGESVARQLGTTPGHVAVLLFRSKQYLRRCVEATEGPEPLRVAQA